MMYGCMRVESVKFKVESNCWVSDVELAKRRGVASTMLSHQFPFGQ